MESPKKQITARIPELIYIGASKKAELKGVTFTDILIEALEQYLGDDLPGLCLRCHDQNTPDARFCQNCGAPLTDDAKKETIEIEKLLFSSPELIKQFVNSVGENGIEVKDGNSAAMITIINLQSQIDEMKRDIAAVKTASKEIDAAMPKEKK